MFKLLTAGMLVIIPTFLNAQNDLHKNAMDKIQIQEAFFGYDLYYPDTAGSVILGSSIVKGEADSTQLIHCYYSMDDKYLNIELEASISYKLTLGYDQFRKKYVLSALDSGPGLVDIYQGNFDSQGNLELDNLASGTHFMDSEGIKHHNRLTFKNMSPNAFELLIEDTIDDGTTWAIQAKYMAKLQ